jgi:prepilin-type N-terminal cleavage/methylation domain-containing protein
MKTTRFRAHRRGFTLLEIMIVVAILGILIGLAFPNFLKSRANARRQICIENLSQIESAKQIWGVETGRANGDVPNDADLFGPTLYMKERPRCPADADYDLTSIGANATCPNGPLLGHVL